MKKLYDKMFVIFEKEGNENENFWCKGAYRKEGWQQT